MKRKHVGIEAGRPLIFGTGLIALDVVVTETGELFSAAGGTCGNVMAILSYMGWISRPVARIGLDKAAKAIISDLALWGVDLSSISIRPLVKTPIIVEKLRRDSNGIPFHTFSFSCPNCNRRFPGYQPVPLKSLTPMERAPSMEVLFLDRASPPALALARRATEVGAVVVFEPPRMREDKNFLALLKLAHIVKYSHDRIDQLDLPNDSSALLEIQTLGRGGARFRTELGSSGDGWHHVEAKPVARMVDSAGCGDWFTAGLISSLCSEGMSSLKRAGDSDILGALDLAQSLAAWNCSFAGPRGGMYTPALKNINAIFNARQSNLHLRSKLSPPDLDLGIYKVCGDCREKPKRMSLRPERRSVGT